jgi:hypothetical protein
MDYFDTGSLPDPVDEEVDEEMAAVPEKKNPRRSPPSVQIPPAAV